MYIAYVTTTPASWTCGEAAEAEPGTVVSFWDIRTEDTANGEFSDSSQIAVARPRRASGASHRSASRRVVKAYLQDAGFWPAVLVYPGT